MRKIFLMLSQRFSHLSKMRQFAIYLGLAGMFAGFISTLVWLVVFREPPQRPVILAVVAPMTGPQAALGEAVRRGAQQWAADKGLRGAPIRKLTIVPFDSAGTPDALQRAARDPDVVAVVRPDGMDGSAAGDVPQLLLSGPAATDDGLIFPLSAAAGYEAQFMANYIRNVIDEKLISVLMQAAPEYAALANSFDETLQRFGTKVVYRWAVGSGEELSAQAKSIADKQVAGTILVLGDANFTAEAVAALGAAEAGNRIIGLRDMATNQFMTRLHEAWHGPGPMGATLNESLVTAPVLFDTAGVEAQAFQAAYRQTYRESPDWRAVIGNDAARLVSELLGGTPVNASGGELRKTLKAELQKRRSVETARPGLAGPIFFEKREGGPMQSLVGKYDGVNLVGAPVQLSPIRDDGVSNYLEQLQAGKILYVVDRFMYKTNLVPSGIRITKVTNLKPDQNTVDLEFMIWFRWNNDASPYDLVFENAVSPVQLGTPERSMDSDTQHYRAWRVRGTFFLNYSNVSRSFGSQLVDVTFRHRTLAQNNLMYVGDVVGMDLATIKAAEEQSSGLLSFFKKQSHGSALVDQLLESRVLAGAPGWTIDAALFSQRLGRTGSNGDPTFVGFGKPASVFSLMSMDVVMVLDEIDLSALVPKALMVYVAILAFTISILAWLLDRKDRGQFWRMQTLFLRLVGWPALLSSGTGLALEYFLEQDSIGLATLTDMIGRSALWIIGARLLTLTIQRFIWAPLEISSGRKVPTVFRILIVILIYGGGFIGIIAFVMGKSVASILATSGLFTFIIGLALQSNLKDIISGVMLNLERPFSIGDFVRINRTFGFVHDVSWRTTRVRTKNGQIVAFPNGRVSESEVENMSPADYFETSLVLYMDPRCSPDEVIGVMRKAIGQAKGPEFVLDKVRMLGIENTKGAWAARYEAEIQCKRYPDGAKVRSAAWIELWKELGVAGLLWATMPFTHQQHEDEEA